MLCGRLGRRLRTGLAAVAPHAGVRERDVVAPRRCISPSAPTLAASRCAGSGLFDLFYPSLHHDDARHPLQVAFRREALIVGVVEQLIQRRRHLRDVVDRLIFRRCDANMSPELQHRAIGLRVGGVVNGCFCRSYTSGINTSFAASRNTCFSRMPLTFMLTGTRAAASATW